MAKLGWGVLGNALIARKCVIPAIHRSRNGKVHALATREPDAARELAADYAIERLYGSFEELLEDPLVDIVYIPLPNHLHLQWSLKAFQAGKHVLCEKPLGCTAAEAQQMFSAARSSGKLLMEGQMYRFHPRTLRVKELIEAGTIGEVRLIRSAFCFAMEPEQLARGDNYRLQPDRGGGALLDVGCYSVGLSCWLLDRQPDTVQGQALFQDDHGVDLHFVGSLRFGDAALAALEASFCSGLQQTYTVVGSRGALELPHDAFIPWDKDALILHRAEGQETGEPIVIPGTDQYQLMVEHFGDCVLHGTAPLVTEQQSVAAMVVLDRLAEAARSGLSLGIEP